MQLPARIARPIMELTGADPRTEPAIVELLDTAVRDVLQAIADSALVYDGKVYEADGSVYDAEPDEGVHEPEPVADALAVERSVFDSEADAAPAAARPGPRRRAKRRARP
jgi:hypothetical protein